MSRCAHCPLAEGVDCPSERFAVYCKWAEKGTPAHVNAIRSKAETDWRTIPAPEPAQKHGYPPLWRQAINFAAATAEHAVAGFPRASVVTQTLRKAACKTCDRYDAEANRCRSCGCHLEAKIAWERTSCPLGKW